MRTRALAYGLLGFCVHYGSVFFKLLGTSQGFQLRGHRARDLAADQLGVYLIPVTAPVTSKY